MVCFLGSVPDRQVGSRLRMIGVNWRNLFLALSRTLLAGLGRGGGGGWLWGGGGGGRAVTRGICNPLGAVE